MSSEPNPYDPSVERMWIVRAAVWFADRRFAIMLVPIGCIVLLSGIAMTLEAMDATGPRYDREDSYEIRYSESGTSSSMSGAYHGMQMSPRALSVFLIVGAALTALGILQLLRRFTLRWLLVSVMAIGAIGTLPHGASPHRGALVRLSVSTGRTLKTEQVEALRELLNPRVALATLPAGYRKMLHAGELAGIVKCDVRGGDLKKSDAGITCELEIYENLSDTEYRALIEFYDYYVRYLVLTSAERESITLSQKSQALSGSSIWEPWRKQWLTAQAAADK